MAQRRSFTPHQYAALREVVNRHKKKKTQADLAKALEITQPSLSKLLSGEYRPGVAVARAIADLDGISLEDLIGEFEDSTKAKKKPNLEIAASYHATKYPPWVTAAARDSPLRDMDPDLWPAVFDQIKAALDPLWKRLASKPA